MDYSCINYLSLKFLYYFLNEQLNVSYAYVCVFIEGCRKICKSSDFLDSITKSSALVLADGRMELLEARIVAHAAGIAAHLNDTAGRRPLLSQSQSWGSPKWVWARDMHAVLVPVYLLLVTPITLSWWWVTHIFLLYLSKLALRQVRQSPFEPYPTDQAARSEKIQQRKWKCSSLTEIVLLK